MTENLRNLANAIRALSMDGVEKANSGHPGMPLGMADVATVLFSKFLKFDSKNPHWADRDRFILSAGHGSMLLYSLLYLTGYEDISLDDLKNFRQLHSKTAGHPEYGYLAGIETTTGPLGQGLANAVGMALGEKILAAKFNKDIVDHYTYTIAGDGCLMEGISHEAISFAGHNKLGKLIVLFDDNNISIDGDTSLSVSDNQLMRFEASNWHTQEIDGHDYAAIEQAIANAKKSDKPSLIACKTTIAFGSPNKSGSEASHGSPLGKDEIIATKKNLGWDYGEFEIPEDILAEWRKIGAQNTAQLNDWQTRLEAQPSDVNNEFERLMSGALPKNWKNAIDELKDQLISDKPNYATRKSSGIVLETLASAIPELLGGSADLSGSNCTKTKNSTPISPDNANGNYIYYGVREHAMAAIMNGLALHKPFIPYGGTFLVFSDYCRPAIRLSALMKQKVAYVMTHDSIGLGEDGPTHQPVEHLAALRSIPNLHVFRPADAYETAECWEIAMELQAPTLFSLTRQNLPALTKQKPAVSNSGKGAYIVSKEDGELKAVILATGSEVHIAIEAQKILAEQNIFVRVVSVPCFELFDQQNDSYKQETLGNENVLRVGVEAAIELGWHKYIGKDGIFIGMEGFGASAPADKLYELYGITSSNIANQIIKKVGQ
jgi:transketolase